MSELDELLIKLAPDLTDAEHIRLRGAIAERERVARIDELKIMQRSLDQEKPYIAYAITWGIVEGRLATLTKDSINKEKDWMKITFDKSAALLVYEALEVRDKVCASCGKPISVDDFGGALKKKFYHGFLPCLMDLAKEAPND